MKCKYRKICPLYDKEDKLCNKDAGMYYANGTEPASCFIKMFKKEEEEKNRK